MSILNHNYIAGVFKINNREYQIDSQRDVFHNLDLVRVMDPEGFVTQHKIDLDSITKYGMVSRTDFVEKTVSLHETMKRRAPEYRHPGPTNKELENPAVKNAWESLQVIRKLAGLQEWK